MVKIWSKLWSLRLRRPACLVLLIIPGMGALVGCLSFRLQPIKVDVLVTIDVEEQLREIFAGIDDKRTLMKVDDEDSLFIED